MELTLFNYTLFLPAHIGVALLAGISFIWHNLTPWFIGVLVGSYMSLCHPLRSKLRSLVLIGSFVIVGIILMPALVVLYSCVFRAGVDASFVLSIITSYSIAGLIFFNLHDRRSHEFN